MSKNNEELDDDIDKIEEKIAKLSAKENRDKVIDNLKEFGENKSSVCTNGMWKVKKRIFPNINPNKPTGKEF